MDLELATLHDISHELLQRDARFVLIVKEATNRPQHDSLWVSGNGMLRADMLQVARRCQALFDGRDRRPGWRRDAEGDP
ncbi:MAG: hypothetical protein GTO03_16920 [Planctomycetales bacterium]|nr:hypothetical protein [Planctomycetales bacterium]